MKASLAVLLVTAVSGTAGAEPQELRLRPVERVRAERIPREPDPDCEQPGVPLQRVVGTTSVEVVHDCGSDAMSQLVLHTSVGLFVQPLTTIAYQGANMTDAPMHITLAGERVLSGKLADGAAAVVIATETWQREIETRSAVVVSAERKGHVEVCTIEAEPACESVTYTCKERGCSAPRLSRGILTIVDLRLGTERLRVMPP